MLWADYMTCVTASFLPDERPNWSPTKSYAERTRSYEKKIATGIIGAGIRCDERDILIIRCARLVQAKLPYKQWEEIPFASEHGGLFPLVIHALCERAL